MNATDRDAVRAIRMDTSLRKVSGAIDAGPFLPTLEFASVNPAGRGPFEKPPTPVNATKSGRKR